MLTKNIYYNMKKKIGIAAGIVAAGIAGWKLFKMLKKKYYDDTLEELYGTGENEESPSDSENEEEKSKDDEEGEKEKKEN